MISVSSTEAVNTFHRLLDQVERGETVRIFKHGRARAKIVRDTDFMSGEDFAKVFRGYRATARDKAAADEIENNIRALKGKSREKIVAH